MISTTISILHIHSSDAAEIRHRRGVAWDRRERVILGHRKGLSGVVMERRIGHSTVQRRARVHALLGLHSKIIGGVTAAGDPVAGGVHVVGILLAVAVHGVVLGHMCVHGAIHRNVLVVNLLVVRVDTVSHVVAPVAVVRVDDLMGRVHDLRATV